MVGKISQTMALPSVLLLHGLGFLLLLAFAAGWGRQPVLLVIVVSLATASVLRQLANKVRARSGAVVLTATDWAFGAFLGLILFSLALQPFGAPWVRMNALYVPFFIFLPYLCGRLMTPHDLHAFSKFVMLLFVASMIVGATTFVIVDDSLFRYRPSVSWGWRKGRASIRPLPPSSTAWCRNFIRKRAPPSTRVVPTTLFIVRLAVDWLGDNRARPFLDRLLA